MPLLDVDAVLYTLLQLTHSHWQHISSFRHVHRIVLLAAAAALSYYATRHRCQCDAKHRREEWRRSRPQTVFTFSLYYFILCALRICWTLTTLFYADEMNIVGIHSLTSFFSPFQNERQIMMKTTMTIEMKRRRRKNVMKTWNQNYSLSKMRMRRRVANE